MIEGSVEVDEGGAPFSSDTSDEQSSSVNESTVSEDGGQETDSNSNEGGEGGEQLTDKGTKLDPDPKSAVHQQLANANGKIKQMERVLGSPELLRKFAKESGMTLTEAKAEIKEVKDEVEEFTADNFKTGDDVAKVFNQIRGNSNKAIKDLQAENQRLRDEFKGINSSREMERITSTMKSDVATVQEKYPELNPKSSDYDSELEQEIGSLYQELDYDEKSGSFRGKVSLVKLTDRIMKAAGKARAQGSKKAQTDVRVKQAGKVVTSSKAGSKDTSESKDPGTAIAQRIQKALGN